MGVLVKKCAQYSAYARTGREQATRGVFPYVLWLLPKAQRADRLAAELERVVGIDRSLFRFATPASLRALLTDTSPAPGATTDPSALTLGRLLAGGVHERS